MPQSHNCGYLDGDLCHGDEHCQYRMTADCYPLGPYFCGKDQIIALEANRPAKTGED